VPKDVGVLIICCEFIILRALLLGIVTAKYALYKEYKTVSLSSFLNLRDQVTNPQKQ